MSLIQPSPAWEATLLSDITGIGTTSGVSVGQSCLVTEAGLEGVYVCATAAASTSTWAVSTPDNVDIAGTLDVTGLATFDAAVTIDGDLAVGDGSTSADIVLDKADADIATLQYHNEGVRRWYWYMTAGEDLAVNRYDNAGSFVNIPFTLSQATGILTLVNGLDITSGPLDVDGLATFDADVTLGSAGPTLTVGNGSTGTPTIEITKAEASEAHLDWVSATFMRWQWRLNTLENLVLRRFDSAGSSLGDMVTFQNSNGRVTLSDDIFVGNDAVVTGDVSAVDGGFTGTVTAGELVAPSFAGEPGGHAAGSIILDTNTGQAKMLTGGGWIVLG